MKLLYLCQSTMAMRTMQWRAPRREFSRRERNRYWRKRGGTGTLPESRHIPNRPLSDSEFGPILGRLAEFQQSDHFCDGTLVSSDGKIYKIHRVLLAANSDYFRAAFDSPLSTNESVVKLEFPQPVVDAVVEFCYTRTCVITELNVQQLLPAADQIGIIGLVKLCCQFLTDNLTLANVYGVFRFASVYGCDELARSAWKMMLTRFVDFVDQSPEFPEMVVSDLEQLLSSSHLNAPSETTVFHALTKWIGEKVPEREKYGNALWNCVRFQLVTPEFYRTEALKAKFVPTISSSNLWTALEAIKEGGMNDCGTPEIDKPHRVPHQVVFAIGGWSTGAPTNYMETYDIRADRWFNLTYMSYDTPRAYHGIVSVDNLIYVIGGFDGTHHFNSVTCFDPEKKDWSERGCLHRKRCYVSCVVVDKEIYAIGGFNGTLRMDSVERYSMADNQWQFVTPMNTSRSDCGAVAVRGKIYVVGGFNGQEILSSAEYYDIKTERWHLLPNLNVQRSGVSLVHFRDNIYAIGGFNGGARLNSVERLNVLRPTEWATDVPPMLSQRSNFASLVLEEKIYVMGGFNGISTIRHCECFDGDKWSDVSSMTQCRSALSVCIVEGISNSAEFTNFGLGFPGRTSRASQAH